MAKKLHKGKSNFTLKRLHQSGNYGNIYERDYVTILNGGTSPEGLIPIYNTIGYKLYTGVGFNGTKIYNFGDWLVNNHCESSGIYWTSNCMPEPTLNDDKIVIKGDTKRLSDFVCYSSASELIRASVDDIIYRFPAELYISNEEITVDNALLASNEMGRSRLYLNLLNDENYFLIKNPMNIDITRLSIPEGNKYSKLRFFCDSFQFYQIISGENIYNVTSWVIEDEPIYTECLTNGLLLGTVKLRGEDSSNNTIDIEIKIYFYENELLLLSVNQQDIHIRPNNEKINEFFNSLDDFQKTLLNRDTDYCATFETYIEDEEDGWYLVDETYQWPVDSNDGDWNLSINGVEYETYIDSLSELAIGYDENFTDAIWRTMTHEAIGNMDLTLYRNGEIENIFSPKIKKVLNIIGRQFDDIKRYADNIKYSNNVTYTQEKNVPDYFLTDILNLKGWETKNILNTVSEDIVSEPVYEQSISGTTASNANIEFLRRLKLNTQGIFSKKGTKQGIEDFLSVFGFHSVEWIEKYYPVTSLTDDLYKKAFTLNEYVYEVDNYSANRDTIERIESINSKKETFSLPEEGDNSFNAYQGLPITKVLVGSETYIIPWFDKNMSYDNKLYFQMKGGWMKDLKRNEEYEITVSNIYSYEKRDNIYGPAYVPGRIYYITSEGKCYRYDGNNLSLYPVKNAIKVENIPSEENNTYPYIYCNNKYHYWDGVPGGINSENVIEIFNEEDLSQKQGNKEFVIYNGKYYQWDETEGEYMKYGSYKEVDNPINIYLESGCLDDLKNKIIDYNKGNNPHSGYYDDGNTYTQSYRNWFINAKFSEDDEDEINTNGLGFNLNLKIDNKCKIVNDVDILSSLYTLNSKLFTITFDSYYEDFIREDVLPYLKQLIPSTAIVHFDFRNLQKPGKVELISFESQDDTNTSIFQITNPEIEFEKDI